MLEKYFKQEGELFVGYHVEGGETESCLIYPSKHVRGITQINLPVC